MGKLDDTTLKGPYVILHRGEATQAFTMPFAPQSVHVTYPSRGQVHQTLGANWLDEFSGSRSVLAHCELNGTFGYRVTAGGLGQHTHGSVHLRSFARVYEAYNALDRQRKRDTKATQEYRGLANLYVWRIWIQRLEIKQSKQDPLLYYYTLAFLRLEDLLNGPGSSVTVEPSTGARLEGVF